MTELNVVEEDETGSETTAVQRWSWHEKQTFCSVWESICVGKKKKTKPGPGPWLPLVFARRG